MAELLSLGLSSIPAPARPAGAGPETVEAGATGTPIFGGFLRELGEYNSVFAGGPFAAFQTYEQMRRGDSQVAATLLACKRPIRGADWTVAAPDDATPVEQEAAEFIEEMVLHHEDFGAAVENALLMLDFGCSAHENVWAVDGNRVVLERMAPRLPLTFYRWICEPGTDRLQALGQLGYRGGVYVQAEVPVERLSLFTYRQEGANFAGRSMLREMYQHWYIKSNLYKVDAIACERNGAGVPVLTMGPDAKAEDRRAAWDWVQKLVVHDKTGLVLPNGWTFALEGVKGTLRDPKDSIHHHNMQITMAGLAQFMMLGESSKGNRALGETMADFFYLGLQEMANQIGTVMGASVIRPLVAWNFGEAVRAPRLVPQQILSFEFGALVEALSKLAAAGAVVPDEELEEWIRRKMGAPERTSPRPAAGMAGAGAAAAPAKPEDTGAGDGATGADERAGGAENAKSGANSGATKLAAADLGQVHVAAGFGAVIGAKGPGAAGGDAGRPDFLRREPRGAEKSLALSEIVGRLDGARDEVAAALREARSRIQAELVAKLVAAPVRQLHRVSVEPDERLIGVVERILRATLVFGAEQVAAEGARQRQGAAPADAEQSRMAMSSLRKRRRGDDDAAGLLADGVVSQFTNTLQSRLTNVAAEWLRSPGAATKGEVIRSIEAEADGQSDKWIDGVAGAGANEAFAEGRAEGYADHADEIGSVVYSALLDLNTCENCAAADGQEGATPEDVPDVPNPDCDGGDRCRCVHVFVFKDEVKSKA